MPTDPNIEKVEKEKNNSKGGILDFIKNSGALKDIYKAGSEILAALTFCKIRPKGTPHEEVHKKAAKFFYVYGTGIFDTKGYKPFSESFHLYDITNGRDLPWEEISVAFPIQDRKKVEVTLRKKCETPTGSVGYYTETKTPDQFKGYVKLKDGKLYDASKYGVRGGDFYSPISLPNTTPLGQQANVPVDKNTNYPVQTPTNSNLGVLALLTYFLTK